MLPLLVFALFTAVLAELRLPSSYHLNITQDSFSISYISNGTVTSAFLNDGPEKPQILYFSSNRTSYSWERGSCISSPPSTDNDVLYNPVHSWNAQNKPLNKGCDHQNKKGQLYAVMWPQGAGAVGAAELCATVDGKEPLYLNVSGQIISVAHFSPNDNGLAALSQLPSFCLAAGLTLQAPYSYNWTLYFDGGINAVGHGTVQNDGVETVMSFQDPYEGQGKSWFFENNQTTYVLKGDTCETDSTFLNITIWDPVSEIYGSTKIPGYFVVPTTKECSWLQTKGTLLLVSSMKSDVAICVSSSGRAIFSKDRSRLTVFDWSTTKSSAEEKQLPSQCVNKVE